MKIGTNQPTVPLAEQQQAKDITKTPSVQPSGDSYTTENPSGTTDQSPSGWSSRVPLGPVRWLCLLPMLRA